MPEIQVIYYQEDERTIPMVEWLDNLQSQPKHRAKCIKSIGLLKASGHDPEPHTYYWEPDNE